MIRVAEDGRLHLLFQVWGWRRGAGGEEDEEFRLRGGKQIEKGQISVCISGGLGGVGGGDLESSSRPGGPVGGDPSALEGQDHFRRRDGLLCLIKEPLRRSCSHDEHWGGLQVPLVLQEPTV